MLNIEALEKALQSVEAIGHEELTFPVGEEGQPQVMVTLELVAPEDEVEVQAYSQEPITDVEDDADTPRDAAMEFLDRWKYGLLSYAIVKIGDMDFRGHDYVETGEKLDNGTPVKVPRYVAMRKLIRKLWKRPILNRIFHKYNELLEAAEKSAEKAVQYKYSDIDAEIELLEARLTEIKQEKSRRDGSPEDPVADQISRTTNVADQNDGVAGAPAQAASSIKDGENRAARRKQEKKDKKKAKKKARQTQEAVAPTPPVAPAVRQSAVPRSGAAPSRAQQAPAPPPAPAPRPRQDTGSFADADDDDALAAETHRLLAARRAAQKAEEEGTNVPGPEHMARVAAAQAAHEAAKSDGARPTFREPPHRQAASTAAAVFDTGANSITAAKPKHLGSVGGVDAHKIRETETLSKRTGATPGPKRQRTDPVDVNQGGGGASNPRFKPPGG